MSSPAWSGRFLSRLRFAAVPTGTQRIERQLAVARFLLAVSSLVAVYLSPGPSPEVAYFLLPFYIIHSLLVLTLLRFRAHSTPGFRFMVHVVDLVWIALITLFTEGPNSPFFALFVFVLLAAAYRWGLQETLATAAAAILLFVVQAELATAGPAYIGSFLKTRLPLDLVIPRSLYLFVIALPLGWLAEEEKQLRAETAAVVRVTTKIQAATGLSASMQAVCDELLRLFDARQALVISDQLSNGQLFLWDARRLPGAEKTILRVSELDSPAQPKYFFQAPGHTWYTLERRFLARKRAPKLLALDNDGRQISGATCTYPDVFLEAHPFRSLLGVLFTFPDQLSGRIIVFNPRFGSRVPGELRFAQALVRQVSPAVYSAYLLRRLRSRAGAIERARVARELHDGVIQSLIGAEMQVDVLRRQADHEPARIKGDLTRIQEILRQEVLAVRELMQEMRPPDLGPEHLLEFLSDLVHKFGRESGVAASFISELEEVTLSPRVCRELARIVQEGLANVRKHSGAGKVLVRLGAQDGSCNLVIDDNGRGFDFEGRRSLAELDSSRRGPAVLKERVRAIGGNLMIESIQGGGARLEVTVPRRPRG